MIRFLLLMSALLVFCIAACGSDTSGSECDPRVYPPRPGCEFSFTIESFISRDHKAADALEQDIQIFIADEDDNGEYLTIQLNSNKNIAFILTTSRSTRAVRDIFYLAQGTGTLDSGIDVLMGGIATIMAIEDPAMPAEQRGDAAREVGLLDLTDHVNGKTTIRQGVEYYVTFSDVIGANLFASPRVPHETP